MQIITFNDIKPYKTFTCYYLNGKNGYILKKASDCCIDEGMRFYSATMHVYKGKFMKHGKTNDLVYSYRGGFAMMIFLSKNEAHAYALNNIINHKKNLVKRAIELNEQLMNKNF